MKDLTDVLLPHAEVMDRAFRLGVDEARAGERTLNLRTARRLYADHRADRFGFERLPQPLLTAPSHNVKLAKAARPSYGLTLQHYVQRIRPRLVVNACPHAGDCVKVCVLDNGHGSFETVQRGRRSKTAFLVEQPFSFAYLLGYELARAVAREARPILFRPNVNSDVEWQLLIPSMTGGVAGDFRVPALGTGCLLYGYSKNPAVLDTDGWIGGVYRVAYSWNERSDAGLVFDFLRRGGSVAVVTDRRKGQPTLTDAPFSGGSYGSVDADLTDEWMFEPGVIGDLSAKGRARRLIGKSGFVVSAA